MSARLDEAQISPGQKSSPAPGRSEGDDGGEALASRTVEICFLLMRNFSLLSFASAIEPLRIANKVLKRKAFTYRCCSLDGSDAIASNGSTIRADCAIGDVERPDLLAVCSSDDVERIGLTLAQKVAIRKLANRSSRIAGICTGAYVLADFGLLDNRNCTIHWEYADFFKERFPDARLVDSLIQTDGKYMTCAGGTSALDLMIGFVAQVHGGAVAADVAEIALHHDWRSGNERQHKHMRDDLETVSQRVRSSIALMTENVVEPLSLQEIAQKLDVSPRQLQREFQKYLKCSPQEYYAKVRLDIARQLVCRTSMRMIDIAMACGFASASHFSKRYRSALGTSPAADRQQHGRVFEF